MANNKKRKKYNSNNRRSANTAAPVTVREKKKQLIRERIHKDAQKSRGMRALGIIVSALLLSRAALFIYEIAYYSHVGERVNLVSNLLLLPLFLILFMVHDGNRGLIGITAVSAIVRMIWLFVSVYPTLEAFGGAAVFVAIYAVVMAAQFIMSVLTLSMPSTDAYCKEMQKINFELRASIMNTRR